MNKTARARGTYAPEPRTYHVEWLDGSTALYQADRGELHNGVLQLEGAAPNGERMFLPIGTIREWWSNPIQQDDKNAPPPL